METIYSAATPRWKTAAVFTDSRCNRLEATVLASWSQPAAEQVGFSEFVGPPRKAKQGQTKNRNGTLWWTNIAMENGHLKMVIFHCYVSSPEGSCKGPTYRWMKSTWTNFYPHLKGANLAQETPVLGPLLKQRKPASPKFLHLWISRFKFNSCWLGPYYFH